MNRMVKFGAALLAASLAGGVHGQAYPSKPIKIVIPFVAGGSSDIVGRAIGSKFQELLGQPAVVENKPGANGSIAAEFVEVLLIRFIHLPADYLAMRLARPVDVRHVVDRSLVAAPIAFG